VKEILPYVLSYRHVRSTLRKYKWLFEFDVQVTVVVGHLGILVTLWSCHEVHYSLTRSFRSSIQKPLPAVYLSFSPLVCDEMLGKELM